MNATEFRSKSAEELETALSDLRKEQFNLRMQRGTGQLSRPSEMNRVRKAIARIKTVMNEKRAGEAK